MGGEELWYKYQIEQLLNSIIYVLSTKSLLYVTIHKFSINLHTSVFRLLITIVMMIKIKILEIMPVVKQQ